MWQVLLLIGVARPIALGRKRLIVGPSSTRISRMIISSPIRSWLASALAAADSTTFDTSPAAERGEKESSALASSMCLPRTWSATSRTLRGETRTNLA